MVNIRKAIEFVKGHGDEISKNRLNCLILGVPALKSMQDKLMQMQNPDGGFSYWVQGVSTMADTVYILSWLDDFQLRTGEIVDRAFDFIMANQQIDGGWNEVQASDGSVKSPDIIPTDVDSRVFITAFCAHWFVRFGRAGPLEAKNSPLEFIIACRRPSGLILDDLQATWDSLVMFSHRPGRKSELFKETLDVMEKLFSPENMKGSKLAYLLTCLRDAGLEAYHPFVNLCTDELMQKQREDGSWDSEYGEKYTTDATIEAIRVLKHYKVI
jgi:hypothetical protein